MRSKHFFFLFLGLVTPLCSPAQITVPPNIEHSAWHSLLQKYVNEEGLVDYEAWQKNHADRKTLQDYLAQFAPKSSDAPSSEANIAALINAYNAFTVEWILQNYPTPSIRKTDRPWKEARWKINGNSVSLDQIEHETLRPLIGWQVHAVLVCAARSCPPLLNQAYTAENYSTLIESAYRKWLSRTDLNDFSRNQDKVYLSKIFDWYRSDFTGSNSVQAILKRYGPTQKHPQLNTGNYSIRYLDYHWGLNDQSDLGKQYKKSFWDWF